MPAGVFHGVKLLYIVLLYILKHYILKMGCRDDLPSDMFKGPETA